MNPGFTGSPLDRADRLRNDVEAFNAALNDWRARVLGLDGLDPVVASEGGLKWISMAEVDVSVDLILLGRISCPWSKALAEWRDHPPSGVRYRCCPQKMLRFTVPRAA
jgi:hypothetical protein